MIQMESFTGSAVGVLTLVDLFAQARGTRGLMPGPIPPVHFSLIARRLPTGMTPLEQSILPTALAGISGAYLFADEAPMRGSTYRITPGRYMVRIEADYYQTVELEIAWPPTPGDAQPINLRPGFAYPFPDVTLPSTGLTLLRGALLRVVSGAAIAGAAVALTDPPNIGPFADAVTDAEGNWVLALPVGTAPPVLAALRFTLPDGTGVVDVPNVALSFGRENSVSQTALRGAVLSTGGIPVANAEIRVSTQPGSVRSGRDGKWTFYLSLLQPDAPARVTATAPNGRITFQDVQIRNRATVVVPVLQIALN